MAVEHVRTRQTTSLRTALVVGVTALGIVSALPGGVTHVRAESPLPVTASASVPLRVSQQDVELMAYIPVWTDAMIAIDEIAVAAEPIVTNAINSTLAVGNSIPFVNVFARQAFIIYNYLIWPIVWLPTTCGVLFLGTLDVGYLNHWIAVTAQSLADFVQAEANYFLYGGWNPLAAAAASAKATAARDGAADSAKTPDVSRPKSGLAKSGRVVAAKAVAPAVDAETVDGVQKAAASARATSPKISAPAGASSPKRGSKTGSAKAEGKQSAGTGHHARRGQPNR